MKDFAIQLTLGFYWIDTPKFTTKLFHFFHFQLPVSIFPIITIYIKIKGHVDLDLFEAKDNWSEHYSLEMCKVLENRERNNIEKISKF